MTQCACPLCGQEVESLPISILPERGIVVSGGRFATLTGTESRILAVLAERAPILSSKTYLMDQLYALNNGDEPFEKILDVYICKIRRKIKPLGIEIVTHWGKGYSLTIENVQIVREEA